MRTWGRGADLGLARLGWPETLFGHQVASWGLAGGTASGVEMGWGRSSCESQNFRVWALLSRGARGPRLDTTPLSWLCEHTHVYKHTHTRVHTGTHTHSSPPWWLPWPSGQTPGLSQVSRPEGATRVVRPHHRVSRSLPSLLTAAWVSLIRSLLAKRWPCPRPRKPLHAAHPTRPARPALPAQVARPHPVPCPAQIRDQPSLPPTVQLAVESPTPRRRSFLDH